MATTKKSSVLPGFERVKGSGRAENFRNVKTGEVLSRRQYDKIRRGGLNNEQLRELNRATAPVEQILRPARGRSSAVKLVGSTRADVAKARAEQKQLAADMKAAAKKEAQLERSVERLKGRKVRVKKFSTRLLKAGHLAVRIPFNTWEEYTQIQKDVNAAGKKVFGYGLGWVGVSVRDGHEKGVTVFRMMDPRTVVDEDEFYDDMRASWEEKQYMIFLHYFIHIGFATEFAQAKSKNKKINRK